MIARIAGWFGRKTFLYLCLVAAILVGTFMVPWLVREWYGPDIHIHRANRLEIVRQQVVAVETSARHRLTETETVARAAGLAEIDRRIGDAERDRAWQLGQVRSRAAQFASLARVDGDAIVADRTHALTIQLRDREIAGLQVARDRIRKRAIWADVQGRLDTLIAQIRDARRTALSSQRDCTVATGKLAEFEATWPYWITLGKYQQGEHARLQRLKRDQCARARSWADRVRRADIAAAGILKQHRAAGEAFHQSRSWADGSIQSVTADIDQAIMAERTAINGSLRARLSLWAQDLHLGTVLRSAGLALLAIMLSPFLIRLVCYGILAPIAMRRPAIRLPGPGGNGAAIPLPDRSATSVAVRLRPNEELLVRQDYVQTEGHASRRTTRWFLDPRHPLTSIATGLTFLTRIRGDGETTTVSATRDPFAEVAILDLPDGTACVLQPRALAAVAQPIDRPLRVTSHWRLFSLNAWLTLQLRYLVFHGPARLVLKGGRGIRVERADQGRIFGQDQLIGFSVDLAYSVVRTEPFWPYFVGREGLLKDRVDAGAGILIVEEAPMADGGRRHVKRGLEGMIDAGMKMFGL